MGIEDYTKPPPDTGASPTSTIETALALAEAGDFSGILTSAFTEAVRKVRVQDNDYYVMKIKSRIKKLKAVPISLSDLDKLTAPPKQPKQRYSEQAEDGSEGEEPANRIRKADLIAMVAEKTVLFRDERRKPYATAFIEGDNGGHYETWELGSEDFMEWLSYHVCYKLMGNIPSDSALKEVSRTLAAKAKNEGETMPVYMRYAPHADGAGVMVDLCDERRRVVEILPTGWRILGSSEYSTKFLRPVTALPIPDPKKGGDVMRLFEYANIKDKQVQILVLTWLLSTMLVSSQYVLLELLAEPGSAKTFTHERLVKVVDNHTELHAEMPDDSAWELAVNASERHLTSMDNMSGLSKKAQDTLCRMCTGGGFSIRKRHTTRGQESWGIKRPVIINGIGSLVTQDDLAQRTVSVELVKLESNKQREQLEREWEQEFPAIVGGLYDLLSQSLAILPTIPNDGTTRQGEFVALGVAVVKALGRDDNFAMIYRSHLNNILMRSAERSPAMQALKAMMDALGTFNGSMGELLADIARYKPSQMDARAWPQSPEGLANKLKYHAEVMRIYGIEIINHGRNKHGTRYTVRKAGNQQTEGSGAGQHTAEI